MTPDFPDLTREQAILVRQVQSYKPAAQMWVTWIAGAFAAIIGMVCVLLGIKYSKQVLIDAGIVELMFAPILILVRLRIIALYEVIRVLSNKDRQVASKSSE
jgi:hypothetical protein